MIQWAPPRRGARSHIAGLGDSGWVSQWLSAGYNDSDSGGRILQFMAAQPNQPAGVDPVSVAQQTGRWVPWSGNAGGGSPYAPDYPYLRFGLPSDQPGNPTALLNLTQAPPRNFVSPGDDAMRWAIQNWVGLNAAAAPAIAGGGPAFSQAVGSTGLTAAQAATIAALSQPGAAQSAVSHPATAGSAAGSPASSSVPASGSGLSSIPWWVWAIGGGLLLWFVMEGSDG